MIIPSKSDSLLTDESPGDSMLRNPSFILTIRSIGIVILVDDDYLFRLSVSMAYDIEEDGDVFFIRIGEGIVRFPIETRDHESDDIRWEIAFHHLREIDERHSGLPGIGRHIALIGHCLRECDTLSGILRTESSFRKLWIYTRTGI
jgi:hypothetical protein